MRVKAIPDGHHTVARYLVVAKVAPLISFLEAAFGAREIGRFQDDSGRVMHAEVPIGDSVVMMGEAVEQFPARQATLRLYVPDADATYAAAMRAGAESLRAPEDQFHGDRTGGVSDPAGNQ